MHLNELRDEALRIATEHGFNEASVLEEIALMHSELSEAVEEYRAGNKPDQVWYKPLVVDVQLVPGTVIARDTLVEKSCGIPSEMADVIIRVLHFCGKHQIDIEKAVTEKMKYNDSRPYKHGKII